MSKELGTNVLLYVRPYGGSGVYTAVSGQQSTSMTRNRAAVNSTDKTTQGFRTSGPGLKEASVSASGQADWPDTDGLKVVEDAWDGDGLVEVYLRQNNAGKGYKGTMMVADCSISGETEDNTQYSIQLNSNSALTLVTSATFNGDDTEATVP